MKEVVEDAKRKGYVTTLLGRRRYIPELSSNNYMVRKFGDRAAMNAPIQGTAADIIKVAMVNIEKELREKNYESKLILQVHDELVIEAKENELEEVKELLVRNMQDVIKLSVELRADANIGKTWYEAH